MKVLGYYWPVLWLILKVERSIPLLSRSLSTKCAVTTTISIKVAQRPRSARDFCRGQNALVPWEEKPSEGLNVASWRFYCDPLLRWQWLETGVQPSHRTRGQRSSEFRRVEWGPVFYYSRDLLQNQKQDTYAMPIHRSPSLSHEG